MDRQTDGDIRPVRETDSKTLGNAINWVCEEKWYLASLDGFARKRDRNFLTAIVEKARFCRFHWLLASRHRVATPQTSITKDNNHDNDHAT